MGVTLFFPLFLACEIAIVDIWSICGCYWVTDGTEILKIAIKKKLFGTIISRTFVNYSTK
jgi:hypothetical protein